MKRKKRKKFIWTETKQPNKTKRKKNKIDSNDSADWVSTCSSHMVNVLVLNFVCSTVAFSTFREHKTSVELSD